MKAPQLYGMFGEDLYKVPSQEQGMVSQQVAYIVNEGKNAEYKAMYDWLGANGYTKIWAAPKALPIRPIEGKTELLPTDRRELYGREGGQESFKEIQLRMAELQDIRNDLGEKDFERAVDEIFNRNFNRKYLAGENIISQASFDELQKKDIDKFKVNIESRKAAKLKEATIEEESGATPQTLEFKKLLNKNSAHKIELVQDKLKRKDETEGYRFLDMLLTINAIDQKQKNELMDYWIEKNNNLK
jgi:hypothetical protein